MQDFSYHLPKLLIAKSNICFILYKSIPYKGIPIVNVSNYSNETPIKSLILLEILKKYSDKVIYLCFFNGKICSLQIFEHDSEDFKYEYI